MKETFYWLLYSGYWWCYFSSLSPGYAFIYLTFITFPISVSVKSSGILLIGLRFGISPAILILNLPVIFFNSIPFRFRYNKVYQAFVNAFFFIVNIFGLMLNLIDMSIFDLH